MGDDRYGTHSPLTVEPVILELLNKLTVLVSQGLSLKRDGFYWGHMDYYKRCRLDMVVLRCRYLWVEKGVLCYERKGSDCSTGDSTWRGCHQHDTLER